RDLLSRSCLASVRLDAPILPPRAFKRSTTLPSRRVLFRVRLRGGVLDGLRVRLPRGGWGGSASVCSDSAGLDGDPGRSGRASVRLSATISTTASVFRGAWCPPTA